MMVALRIALEEWRLWRRSRLAVTGLVVFVVLLAGTTALTAVRMHTETTRRLAYQAQADQRFVSQPGRHPHRMVHYGHYVFRTPPFSPSWIRASTH